MKTKRWNVKKNHDYLDIAIEEAVTFLKDGDTVAFPTETVYGLGADATNPHAVKKIFKAKGRPQDNPLIAHVASKEQLLALISDLPPYVENLLNEFTPGPLTFVLPSNGVCAENVTASLDTVAVRIPDHPIAQKLLLAFNGPLAAPSANISGKPSPTEAEHVFQDLAGKIAGLIDGGPTGIGVESTVIDCTGDIPVILRPGAITEEQIRKITKEVKQLHAYDKIETASPGLKYKHYTPDVPLWVVSGSKQYMQSIIDEQREQMRRVGLLARTDLIREMSADQYFSLGDDLKEVATKLYNGLRTFTKEDVDIIVCEALPEIGIGEVLMNRLMKASSQFFKQ